MGDWAIVVQGTGAHHNKDYPQNANKMTEEFVQSLRRAGHQVRHASFTHGGREDMTALGIAPEPAAPDA